MALRFQSSFSAGELDPALHERTTLERYDSALDTARNVIIGKTGRVMSRFGRSYLFEANAPNRRVKIYAVPHTTFVIEFGHLYAKIRDRKSPEVNMSVAHTFTEDEIQKAHFETSVEWYGVKAFITYVFREGKQPFAVAIDEGFTDFQILQGEALFPSQPTTVPISGLAGTPAPAGHEVEYYGTAVIDGREGPGSLLTPGTTLKFPIAAGQFNTIMFDVTASVISTVSEFRIYRRPKSGGTFGYIGSTAQISYPGGGAPPGTRRATFVDVGVGADYGHTPPEVASSVFKVTNKNPANLLPQTATLYQQRLLLASGDNITASRTGYLEDFTRDFPYNSASSLSFKTGTSGSAKILRMIDSDGLIAFTTAGVYVHSGSLEPTNLAFVRKGNWVIDPDVPPIAIPGGVIFVDASTNSVRSLNWSNEKSSYVATELSIFSNHLFVGKRVTSMAFQEGDIALLWVTFDDGTYASLTFDPDQQMRAWTRHDSVRKIEQVASTSTPGETLFVSELDGVRSVEVTAPRYVSGEALRKDPNAYMFESIAPMDMMMSKRYNLLDMLVAGQSLTVTPVVPGNWAGSLTLNSGSSNIFLLGGAGAVGTVLRYFDQDGAAIDLEVTARANDNNVTVTPSETYPSTAALDPNMYITLTEFDGAPYPEGSKVTLVSDGYVVASPNNDEEVYPVVTVGVGGMITFPSGLRGAIIHVGEPVTCDAGTLDVATVEQRPVFIESKTVNKFYIKVMNTRGLYAGNTFPKNGGVKDMIDLEKIEVDYEEENPIIANRYQKPRTVRYEVSVPGDWRSQGRICLRQVDPVHFEILSIVPDLEDLRR